MKVFIGVSVAFLISSFMQQASGELALFDLLSETPFIAFLAWYTFWKDKSYREDLRDLSEKYAANVQKVSERHDQNINNISAKYDENTKEIREDNEEMRHEIALLRSVVSEHAKIQELIDYIFEKKSG